MTNGKDGVAPETGAPLTADQARFFLDRDDSGHWYVVRADRRAEWDAWTEQLEREDDDHEPDWNVPDYAQAVGGSHTLVTFTNPVIE